jgi:uncharacterized protein YgbK (DUF1537 family)
VPRKNLSDRTIRLYNRLVHEMAAMNYTLHFAKPGGTIGKDTIAHLNAMSRLANRLFCQIVDLPRFAPRDPDAPMTHADLTIHVARMTSAALYYEEFYRHHSAEGRAEAKQAAYEADKAAAEKAYAAEGLPSPHL